MATLILDRKEQNYGVKQREETLKALAESWKDKAFDMEDDIAHIRV